MLKNGMKAQNDYCPKNGSCLEIAIIGTGPSGVYCALRLIEEFKKTGQKPYTITLFDPKETLSTILPTGNGRCNLTFCEFDFKKLASFYPRGEKFLYSIFSRYGTAETLEYFEKIGIKTYTQEDRRIFPVSNSTKKLRTQMISELLKSKNIKIVKKEIKNIKELYKYDITVLATGSKDRSGLTEQFGHTITPLKPALCGLKIKDIGADFPTGVSLNTDDGGIIFTHSGVSGPFIFKITSKNAYKEFPYEINIPILNTDELFELLHKNSTKSFGNVVSQIIPRALTKYLFNKNKINFEKQAAHAKKDEIEKLKSLTLIAENTDGKGEIVHAGGVKLNEVDKNCHSKIAPALWIIGENLDIDGLCGGFNLQNCWSTAAIAAEDIVKFCNENNKIKNKNDKTKAAQEF